MSKPSVEVFISYAHRDKEYFEVFIEGIRNHLFTSSNFDFGVWDDSKIVAGSIRDEEIQDRLAKCDLAILCVSVNFLNADYIEANEFGKLITTYKNTLIIPVYFNHCHIKAWDELAKRQFFKPDGGEYGMDTQKDFCFCDLINFRSSDGKANPNANREIYFMDLVARIEDALNQKPVLHNYKTNKPAKDSPVYVNQGSYPFFESDNFFGRTELLKQINDKLSEVELPLLLSGIGGMGKTAVAVAYGKNNVYCNQYDHIAWVGVTENIFSSLFSSFQGNTLIPFDYDQGGIRENDINNLMKLFYQVPGKNLLLIDNVNNENELTQFIALWKKHQPGWKCLITTRCDNNVYKKHLILLNEIDLTAAIELYKRHNDENFDELSFTEIYEYVGRHTFLIELLAKFGQESSTISSTAELLKHLKTKGIKALNRKVIARQVQQLDSDQLVSGFVLGLYDPMVLPENEKVYMRYFALLPAKELEFETLATFFGIPEPEKDEFDNCLNSLYKKGWLIHSGSTFKCHQIIREICRDKLMPDIINCDKLIECIADFFKKNNTSVTLPFFEAGYSVINTVNSVSSNLAILQFYLSDRIGETGNILDVLSLLKRAKETFNSLMDKSNEAICLERLGDACWTLGDRKAAFDYFQQYNNLQITLMKDEPENLTLKNGLAISYSKHGKLYRDEGKIEEAFNCFTEGLKLMKEIVERAPDNSEYKYNLAILYSKVGYEYYVEGNIKFALEYYEKDLEISKEIVDENPENLEYKYGLALAYGDMGDMYLEKGDKENAHFAHHHFNKLMHEIAEKDPENLQIKIGLAISYRKLGDWYLKEGNNKDTLMCYSENLRLTQDIADKIPENVNYKNALAISYGNMGDWYLKEGNIEAARNYFLQYNKLGYELVEKNPENIYFINTLAFSYAKLGDISSRTEKKAYYNKARELWEELVNKVPQIVEFKNSLERLSNFIKELE